MGVGRRKKTDRNMMYKGKGNSKLAVRKRLGKGGLKGAGKTLETDERTKENESLMAQTCMWNSLQSDLCKSGVLILGALQPAPRGWQPQREWTGPFSRLGASAGCPTMPALDSSLA